jgi:hypothetical protein
MNRFSRALCATAFCFVALAPLHVERYGNGANTIIVIGFDGAIAAFLRQTQTP